MAQLGARRHGRSGSGRRDPAQAFARLQAARDEDLADAPGQQIPGGGHDLRFALEGPPDQATGFMVSA